MVDIDKNLLRAANGKYKTHALFYEQQTQTSSTDDPIFTLKEHDHKGYISLKKLYIEAGDVTEYKFAMEVFGSWKHWQKLVKANWFKPHLEAWREELEVKLKSEAIIAIHETAKHEGSKGTGAAKWIAESKWKQLRGRPSKEEVERQKRIAAGVDEEVEAFYSEFEEYKQEQNGNPKH